MSTWARFSISLTAVKQWSLRRSQV